MNQVDIINSIYKYYPIALSAFEEPYYNTDEHKRLIEIKALGNKAWDRFFSVMTTTFDSEYVNDRTENCPSNQCVINIYKGDLLFEVVVLISKLVPQYTYYVSRNYVNRQEIRTEETGKKTNEAFPEIEAEISFIISTLQKHFQYTLIQESDYNIVILDISTNNKSLGKATIFDAIFTDSKI